MGMESEHLDTNGGRFKKRVEQMLADRNPYTEADQQELLDNLVVVDAATLPTEIQAASRQHATTIGTHTKRLGDNTQLRVTTLPNGIIDVQHIKKSRRRVLAYPTYDLLSYYLIDATSKKAFDVSQLLRSSGDGDGKSLDVLVVPDIQEIALARTKEGDVILLGSYKPSPKMTPNYIDYLKRTALPHESAHSMQSKHREGEYSLNQILLERKFAFLLKWRSAIEALLARPSPSEKQARTMLRIQGRAHRVWEERNAHAFTLALIKKLRTLGIDMMRGMSADQITENEDKILQTYDASKWLSTDRPLATLASQRFRRLRRGMDISHTVGNMATVDDAA
ncbi:hypothetical protein HY411_00695 [Candidatus Gottesmanbacteria bacterium]|nr:hypothetical protein [Candidatus Gottesmanbacteria bacterium]